MDHYAGGSREVLLVRGAERQLCTLTWAHRRDGNDVRAGGCTKPGSGQGLPAPGAGAGNATTRPLGCDGSGPPQVWPTTSYQTAPSTSMQIPSGWSPGVSAHTRRLLRPPSLLMS